MKSEFTRFLKDAGGRLHAAAHSHHPWPDVTFAAHQRSWEEAARLWDDKWDLVFDEVLPSLRAGVGRILGLGNGASLAFAPNTHEFILRIASNLSVPFRVLTTDAEFHSFSRQLVRWEEAGIAEATRVPAEPFETFEDRFIEAISNHDLIFFSHVHYNSGFVTEGFADIVSAVPDDATVVIDGYHGFMALPTDLASVADRAFYLAGGYKYAMAGEGACFLHVPPRAPKRPVNTGWWAGFGSLTNTADEVAYGSGGQRFAGATADPSGLFRLLAVLELLERKEMHVARIHRHVRSLQSQLLEQLPDELTKTLIPAGDLDRGHFLTFRRPDAADLYRSLHAAGVVTDYRGDRWRIGLGIYHDVADIDRLAALINDHL